MPSLELCRKALACAEKLLEWIENNKEQADAVATSVVGCLKKCFHKSRSPRVARDRMWGNYYRLRSSDEYRAFWTKALSESINEKACPIFYQFVAERLITSHFPVDTGKQETTAMHELDFEEQSALRYTVGSVIRSLSKLSKHPLKEEMALCLAEMSEQSGICYILSQAFTIEGKLERQDNLQCARE